MGEVVVCVFTVFFEDPFWVGVFERVYQGNLEIARIVFGAEPTEPEIQEFLLNQWNDLQYTVPVSLDGNLIPSTANPKRALRLARRQMERPMIGTKSQQALQDQRTEWAKEHKQISRIARQESERQKFFDKQNRKKQKKRGH